jgi:hypothetical protein
MQILFNFFPLRIVNAFNPIYVFLKTRPNPDFLNSIQR